MSFTLDSDNQFTLTCISTGGPATMITWTRNYGSSYYYAITITQGTKTVLDDPVTAQYTHTATLTGKMEGLYTCTVINNISHDSAQLHVEGEMQSFIGCVNKFHSFSVPYRPYWIIVSQNGLKSVLVTWQYDWPNVTGYHVSYYQQYGEHNGSTTVGKRYTNVTITGLVTLATYSISIVANSTTLPSYSSNVRFTLRMYKSCAVEEYSYV